MDISPIFESLFCDNLNDPRYYQCYGGRGSGKSLSVSVASVTKTYSEYGHRILYLRQVMTSSEDSTIADVELAMKLMGVRDDFTYSKHRFRNKITGSTISFKGIEAKGSQTAKLKSLSGITTVIIEEAEEIKSFDEFSKIDEGVRVKDKPLKIILVYNPGSAISSWIHKEWFIEGQPNPERFHDTIYLHSTYLDNLNNLAESTIQRYRDLERTNPLYYRNTILAEWTLDTENRVYGGWGEWPEFCEEGDTWYGLDFGYGGKDSTSLIKIVFFEKAFYISEKFSKPKLSISEIVSEMRRAGVSPFDLIVADSAVPLIIEEIRKAGFRRITKVKKGPHSKDQGIKKVQDMSIIMVGDNPNLYFHYMTFKQNKDGSYPHEPDPLAAARYGLTFKRIGSDGNMSKMGGRVIESKQGFI